MRSTHPRIDVKEAMLVDTGAVVTGGGVSLCIDTTLHLIAGQLGQHVADETARIMEYQRAWRANRDGFAPLLAKT
jgi:transcriptional regulator GlxA family with amidase domain